MYAAALRCCLAMLPSKALLGGGWTCWASQPLAWPPERAAPAGQVSSCQSCEAARLVAVKGRCPAQSVPGLNRPLSQLLLPPAAAHPSVLTLCLGTAQPFGADGRSILMYHTKASEEVGEGRLVNALEFRFVPLPLLPHARLQPLLAAPCTDLLHLVVTLHPADAPGGLAGNCLLRLCACSWDSAGLPVLGRPAGVPPRYTFKGERRPHPTLHYKVSPVACSAVMAPPGSPDDKWVDEVEQPVHHRTWLVVFLLAVSGIVVLRRWAKAEGGPLLPRARHTPVHRS